MLQVCVSGRGVSFQRGDTASMSTKIQTNYGFMNLKFIIQISHPKQVSELFLSYLGAELNLDL